MIERAFGGNGHGAKQAKAHSRRGFSMMARRAAGDKGGGVGAGQHRIDRCTGPAYGVQGRRQTAGR